MEFPGVDPSKLPRDWRSVLRTAAFAISVVGAVAAIAAAVARPICEARIAPVVTRMEEHITRRESADQHWDEWLERHERRDRRSQAKLDALCRATPRANCPFGDE